MEKRLSDSRMSENMSFWVKIPIFSFLKGMLSNPNK